MEIGQLEAFLTAVRLHSFSRAASELGVTQPTLSTRILLLENDLGEPLFDRVGRGVRLTDAGRTFVPYAQRALDTLERGRETVTSSRTAATGRLHIGAARGISSAVLPGILETFHERYPAVDVAIKTGRSSEVLEWVLSEQIQVGVSRELNHPEVETTHLYDEEIVLVTHPEHRFALDGRASIYEVGSEPLIIYDKERSYFVLMEPGLPGGGHRAEHRDGPGQHRVDEADDRAGAGVSFLPYKSLERELRTGTLAHVQLEEGHRITLPTAAMVRKASSYGPLVTAFLDLLRSMYGDGEPEVERGC